MAERYSKCIVAKRTGEPLRELPTSCEEAVRSCSATVTCRVFPTACVGFGKLRWMVSWSDGLCSACRGSSARRRQLDVDLVKPRTIRRCRSGSRHWKLDLRYYSITHVDSKQRSGETNSGACENISGGTAKAFLTQRRYGPGCSESHRQRRLTRS